MPVAQDKMQIAVVLPKKYVELLDQLAEVDLRTRSGEAAKILIEAINKKFEKEY